MLPTSIILFHDGVEAKRAMGFMNTPVFLGWLQDTSFMAFASWQVFDKAKETALQEEKWILILVLRTRADLENLRALFNAGAIRERIRTHYVPTLLLLENASDRPILDTLGVRMPETAFAGMVTMKADGTERKQLWLTMPALSEAFLLEQLAAMSR